MTVSRQCAYLRGMKHLAIACILVIAGCSTPAQPSTMDRDIAEIRERRERADMQRKYEEERALIQSEIDYLKKQAEN